MSFPIIKTGSYSGTTAAQTITLGFRPDVIYAVNLTDSDTHWTWSSGFTSGTVGCIIQAASCNASSVTVTDHGFSLPASDNIVNENGKSYGYWAARGN